MFLLSVKKSTQLYSLTAVALGTGRSAVPAPSLTHHVNFMLFSQFVYGISSHSFCCTIFFFSLEELNPCLSVLSPLFCLTLSVTQTGLLFSKSVPDFN